jgi:hypothetical protein
MIATNATTIRKAYDDFAKGDIPASASGADPTGIHFISGGMVIVKLSPSP